MNGRSTVFTLNCYEMSEQVLDVLCQLELFNKTNSLDNPRKLRWLHEFWDEC
ncbi:hypothetical protein DGI_2073 [Megalodesulfovibrio gigas DSM 1382 = ATCC 19364]|uniref:Uncharacterized protein n=1 Tax=Megalodesulfovibrio gigas (strain ATCC 19364 / DSM 1382 / NCIMB 9332 / VKM B-1759) TaxID=1121448 RepID=T2GB75_MEGG1|nr:hypothetical protein DGI_2073 [Megalodesulfovibrio gigas DSM 1382 = ATCC 19364]